MDTKSLLSLINNSKKKTPVKVYIQGKLDGIPFGTNAKVLNMGSGGIVIGDWEEIKIALENHKDQWEDYYIESDRRNSAIDLLDVKDLQARIEPGAMIREGVEIESDAVVMMGACINIGAKIGEKTLIDMNAVIGARASIGKRCHIGAGAIIKGVISSPTAEPVVIEDDVVIGPNAIIMEGIRIEKGAVVRPGVIVIKDVQEGEII